MSDSFKLTLVWLLCGAGAFALAMLIAPITFSQGELVPMGPDSFYHARRILDTVADPSAFYQFDARIHAPEGSWLTWPWGYDWSVAMLVRGITALSPGWRPENVLAYLPPLWLLVNAALVLRIARALGLSLWMSAIAVLCFAVLPLTQNLHNVGRIDHHYIEHTFTLGALCAGLLWARDPGSRWRAAVLGLVLGVASAFHNSLFVLQVPLIATLIVLWVKGVRVPGASGAFLGLGLVAGALVAVLPSGPFWDGQFAFYTLSGFHLYVAVASALFSWLLCRVPFGRGAAAAMAAAAVLATLPLASSVHSSMAWFGLDYAYLRELIELRPLVGTGRLDTASTLSLYSGLIVLVPISGLVMLWRVLVSRSFPEVLFCVYCLFGAAFMIKQVHFHYLGSYTLYLPVLLGIQYGLGKVRRARAVLAGVAVAALVAAYWWPLQRYAKPVRPNWDLSYYVTRPLYPRLAQACAGDPGVVLASLREGHYIRYHTECSVIANPMIVTRQQHEKVKQAADLLERTPESLRDGVPWVKYVLVTKTIEVDAGSESPTARQLRHGLPFHLLQAGETFPPGYELLAETTLENGEPVARVFRIVR